jgi:NAD(P)-dependent dehydrogenase (short-subunit alcohol dehydrogenase family)
MQLEGKKVIVTGGSQGMGYSTVQAFVAEGATVALMDIKDDLGQKAAELANSQGPGSAKFYHANVSNRSEVESAFATAVEDMGGLDVLVNVAGVQRRKAAEDFTDEDLDFILNINLRGTIITNQTAFKTMRHSGGTILNFGSDAGLTAMPLLGAYSASKGGVMAWNRTIAGEWARYGIRANSVVPAIATPMTGAGGEAGQAIYSGVPLGGKLGDPARDFAPVMVFLASDGARFITGQIISVNGGLVMSR